MATQKLGNVSPIIPKSEWSEETKELVRQVNDRLSELTRKTDTRAIDGRVNTLEG